MPPITQRKQAKETDGDVFDKIYIVLWHSSETCQFDTNVITFVDCSIWQEGGKDVKTNRIRQMVYTVEATDFYFSQTVLGCAFM